MRRYTTGILVVGAIGAACLFNAGGKATMQSPRPAEPAGVSPRASDAAAVARASVIPAAETKPLRSNHAVPGSRRPRNGDVPAQPSPAANNSLATPPSADPTTSGVVVAIDPETGQYGMPERGPFRPLTIEELQAIAHREAEGLVTVRHADGSESIEHQGRFAEYAVMRIGPDGKQTFQCVHGDHGVHDALRKDQPIRSAQEEK